MKFIQLALILQTYLLGLACVTNADRLGYSHHLIGAGAKATGHHPTISTVIGRNLSEDDEEEKETGDEEEKEIDDEEEKEIDDTNQIIDTETMSIFDLVAANEDLSVLVYLRRNLVLNGEPRGGSGCGFHLSFCDDAMGCQHQ